jgi:hypothetical protein
LTKNRSKKEIKIVLAKDSQLRLLMNTPTAKDLKIIYRSGRTNTHWPFVDIGKNVVEVGRGRRELIP